MEIHIPRSYNGPITIHVATGNLDEHILFSREVKERSVVLREGRFARGCFIGRQGFDDDDDDDDGGEDGAGGDKGSGVCEACRKNQDQNDEKQKAVASSTTTAIPGTSTGPTPADVLSKPTTPLHIVKRKPAKSLSLQNPEKTSISSSLSPSMQETPSSPPPPPATTSTTTTTTKPISDSPSPLPSSTTPLDILTNRPSFLDVDPMNGRARRSSEFHLTMAPYKSSPLRYSMTSSLSSSSSSSSSPPPLPLSLEERRRRERERREAEAEGGRGGGEKREWVSLLNQGEEGRGGVVGSTSPTPTSVIAMPEPVVDKVGEGEGDGKRPKIVRLDEMSSLPSSSEEEEENENDGDGGGSGSGSGSDTYESAESAIGNETAEEASTQMVSQNQQEKEEEQPEVA
ncbi:hypothetical protein AGABI2DRAFT_194518, partial [Agaricus bisporus var. bisporus H97]|uniref:hypothetical protein n=1 Tax=Agaricus bisporus var. bisporus (strain H97 / ATCC MYA-4626 / FGSC 10389) TaxID=936046 RepID=UPI00029F6A85